MLNIEEIIIYIIIIIGIIVIVQIYNKMNHTVYPIFEGLTNTDNTQSTTPTVKTVNGLNAGSAEYNQDIIGLITVSEVELNISKYSDEYVEILQNLKKICARKALNALLQINTSDPSNRSLPQKIQEANIYNLGIQTIDNILPIVNNNIQQQQASNQTKDPNTNNKEQTSSWRPW